MARKKSKSKSASASPASHSKSKAPIKAVSPAPLPNTSAPLAGGKKQQKLPQGQKRVYELNIPVPTLQRANTTSSINQQRPQLSNTSHASAEDISPPRGRTDERPQSTPEEQSYASVAARASLREVANSHRTGHRHRGRLEPGTFGTMSTTTLPGGNRPKTRGRQGDDDTEREPLIRNGKDRKKDAVLRHKLRTYNSIMAIRAGYLPSTQQLTAWGNRLLRTNPLLDSRQRGLSTESRAFVRDLRAWVEALIDLGVQKNGQDLVQEFIWHTQHANVDVDGSGSVGNRSEVREDSGEAVKKLRTLGSLLWSNSEFRDMLGEAIAVAREMFADAASNVASNANAAADSARSDNDFELPSTSDVKNKVHESLFSSKEELESYLREKFPQQRRDSAVERLKKIVKEVQSKPEFQGTMEFLIELGKKYINRLKDQAEGVHVDGDDNFEKACNDAHAILESFTGKKPLDDLNSAFRKLIQEIQNDDELTSFYSDASHTLHLFLTDPSHVDSNAAHDLYARSKSLLDEKKDTYAPAASYLSTATQSVVHALKTDKPSSRLLAASRTLAASSMSLSMLADLAPRALTSLHYLPLPPITYHSSDYKLHLSELLLESTAPSGFLPKHTLIDALQHLDITTAPIPASSLSTSSHIKLSNLSLRLTDAAFSLQKKSGFLRFRDTGTISIQIAGASAEIHLTTNTNTSANTHAHAAWDVADVAVDIHDFSYNYRGDRHAWAATLLGPFLRPAVRKLLEKVLEARIHEALETAGREVLMLREDVAAAAGKNKDKGWMQWGQAVWSKIRGVGGGGGGGRDAGEGWLAMLEGVRGGDGWGLDSGVEERAPEGEGGWRSNVFEIGSTS